MKVVQRTDLYVGAFLVAVTGIVIAALVVTSGWGIKHFDLYIRTDDARDIAIDTKIHLQGLEVGRVVAINARPDTAKPGTLDFIIRAQMLAEFENGDSLILTRSMDAEVETGLLGGATLTLDVHNTPEQGEGSCNRVVRHGRLLPGDTICMHRRPAAMEAFGNLATDLKSTLSDAIVAATGTLHAYRRLADSLSLVSGTARGFVQAIRPGTEQTLSEAARNLARIRRFMDTTEARSGTTLQQVNLTMEQTRATMEQSRRLMVSADSLTRLLTAMGAENRPELRAMLLDARFLTQQLMYVMEQLSRRPMRAMTGVELPDSLTAEGRARQLREDSARIRQP